MVVETVVVVVVVVVVMLVLVVVVEVVAAVVAAAAVVVRAHLGSISILFALVESTSTGTRTQRQPACSTTRGALPGAKIPVFL